MLKEYNYYALHYHMKKSGTRTVIENIFSALKNERKFLLESGMQEKYITSKEIKHIKIPELDYSEKKFSSFNKLYKYAKNVAKKIENNLDLSKKCIIHAHNVNLSKNIYLATALRILAKKHPKKIIILMQVHDFAEDNRKEQLNLMLNATGKKNQKIAGELAYPQEKNIFYLTINSRDKELLINSGVKKERVFIFENAIDVKGLTKNPVKNNLLLKEIEKYSKKEEYYFDIKRENIIYPVKIIERKNVIEALLILRLLNSINDKYQLLITLDANSPRDIILSNKIKDFVKKEKLPVVIGFGWKLINPSKRKKVKGKIIEFIIPDLFYHAKAIITTSKLEGFGFTFLEGWLNNKEVVGRKIQFVQKDFENNGIKFPGFYNKILIEKKDFKDLSVKKQFEVVKNFKKYNLQSQTELKNILNEIINPNKRLIKENKIIIRNTYDLKGYKNRFYNIIKNIEEFLEKDKTKIEQINNKFLIDYFKTKKEKKIIITDLDGTLIDDKYSFNKTKSILNKLYNKNIPVCFCTSKSFYELEELIKESNNTHPFIAENGSAIFIPKNYFSFKINNESLKIFNFKKIRNFRNYIVIELNVEHKKTIKIMKKIQKEINFETKIFSKLSAEEINKITNLPIKIARLSKIKSFADGFFIPNSNAKKISNIKKLAAKFGFSAVEGGRFVGINKGANKGLTTKILIYLFEKEFKKIYSIGLGDSKNDFSMLKVVDTPYLIKRNGKDISKIAKKEIKNIKIINEYAPNGWKKAIKNELYL